MFFSLLLSLLSTSSNYVHNPLHEYKINSSHSIDYFMDCESVEGVGELNSVFFNGFDSEFVLSNFEGNQTDCELYCNVNNACQGYVWYQNGTGFCNTLTNISKIGETNFTSESYQKVVFHHPPLDEFVIEGLALAPYDDYTNVTLYVDLNMNGRLDPGEPTNTTYNLSWFDFYGLPEGSYSIRMIEPEGCMQIYPGYYGYERYYISEGYVDEVTYFSDGGNKVFKGLHGGIIGQGLVDNPNFSFILGNSSDTYLSFYDNNSIILTITNDVIVDNDGPDLFFNLYQNSSVHANVSVSFNGSYFVYIGELNDTTNSFDLASINFDLPVRFVRLHFHCHPEEHHGEMVPRNIISIYGQDDLTYSPAYAYYTDSDSLFPLFIYDCSFYFRCNTYCNYRVNRTNRYSCSRGCDMFEENRSCNCLEESINNENLNVFECEMGCAYNMEKLVYPNYTVYRNAQGFNVDSMGYSACQSDCFNEVWDECSNSSMCHAFSIDGRELSTYHSFRHYYRNHSFFIAKTELGGEALEYYTTTPTTTQTTSQTSTQTSTETSSQTTSQTSSQTTSQTSTQSTSPTSTILPDSSESQNVMNGGTIAAIVIVILILVLGIIGYLVWNHRKNQTPNIEPRDNYSNPVYNPNTGENTENGGVTTFYADVPEPVVNNYLEVSEYSADTGYMDVAPDTLVTNESNI